MARMMLMMYGCHPSTLSFEQRPSFEEEDAIMMQSSVSVSVLWKKCPGRKKHPGKKSVCLVGGLGEKIGILGARIGIVWYV